MPSTPEELIEKSVDVAESQVAASKARETQAIIDRIEQVDTAVRESSRELRSGLHRLEGDMHERLNRIERQTTETNGRVTKLEAWQIASEARQDAEMRIRAKDRSWVQPVVTGVVTVLIAAIFVALLNLDRI